MVSYCDQSLSVFSRLPPPKRLNGFWNNFTGRFVGWPSTKIAQTVLLHWSRWPPELKIEKKFKWLLLLNQKMDFEIIHRNVSWVTLYQNCSNDSATLNKMATRAINRNKLLTISSAKPVYRVWNNFTEMFLGLPSTKIAQMVPLLWTKWPPGL